MSSVIGAKRQVTVAKEVRDALGVKPGWRAVQWLEGKRVVLEFLPPTHRRSLAGILHGRTTVRVPAGDAFENAVEQAWAASVGDPKKVAR
jgi:bifunctional DNA-binding transcriptional regulator/antitoxin component of YhaV-PrlF toxin-antitoxin module